jgi:hypothetical protein
MNYKGFETRVVIDSVKKKEKDEIHKENLLLLHMHINMGEATANSYA